MKIIPKPGRTWLQILLVIFLAALNSGLAWKSACAFGENAPAVVWDLGTETAGLVLNHHPGFDQQSKTFTYRVGVDQTKLPRELAGRCTYGIDNPWLVYKIRIEWEEKSAGYRTLLFHTSGYLNGNGEKDNIRVALPGNKAQFIQTKPTLPTTGKNTDLNVQIGFKVTGGLNSLELENTAYSWANVVTISSLKLIESTQAPELLPTLEAETGKTGNIFAENEPCAIKALIHNAGDNQPLNLVYSVRDYYGREVAKGKIPFLPGKDGRSSVEIKPKIAERGYFECRLHLENQPGKTIKLGQSDDTILCRFGTMIPAPVPKEKEEDSHFGSFINATHRDRIDQPFIDRVKLASAAGIRWQRIDFHWDIIQPAKGKFVWDKKAFYDQQVKIYDQYNFNIIGTIFLTPRWAAKDSGLQYYMYSPPDEEDWANFVSAIVSRYKGKIKYWEIWNEVAPWPLSIFWTSDSKAYLSLLKTACAAAKKADPECKIMSGGLVHRGGMNLLNEILDLGGRKYFDILSGHYGTCKDLREVMEQKGYSPPFTIDTEFRYNTSGTEKVFAESVVKMTVDQFAEGVDVLIHYIFENAYDIRVAEAPPGWDFNWTEVGLITSKLSPLPGYLAYRTMTRNLERRNFAGKIETVPGIEAYLFTGKGMEPVTVLWSKDGSPTTVNLCAGTGKRAVLSDIMDNGKEVRVNKQGLVTLSLDSSPVYLIGGDERTLLLQTKTKIEPEQISILSGESAELSVKLANVLDTPLRVKLDLYIPEGWQGRLADEVLLQPKQAVNLPCEIGTPATAGHEEKDITLLLSFIEPPIGKVEKHVRIITDDVPPGRNLFPNSGFERSQNGRDPDGYMLIGQYVKEQSQETHEGEDAVQLRLGEEETGAGIRLLNRIRVIPGEKYLLGLWCKGSAKTIFAAHIYEFDKDKEQVSLGCLTFGADAEWRKASQIYTVPQGVYSIQPTVIVGKPETGVVYIDDVEFFRLPEGSDITESRLRYRGKCVKAMVKPIIDGDLSEWKKDNPIYLKDREQAKNYSFVGGKWVLIPMDGWKGESDLSATVYTTWDEENFYLACEVKDDIFFQPFKEISTEAYQGDSIQFAVDPYNRGKPDDLVHFIMAKTTDGDKVARDWNFSLPEIPVLMYAGVVKEAKLAIKPTAAGMNYELAVPLAGIYPLELKPGKRFGFSILINDNDGKGRKGWMCWGDGIGETRDANKFGVLECISGGNGEK